MYLKRINMRTFNNITYLTYLSVLVTIHLLFILILIRPITCQIVNRPPKFVPGSGDMSKFSLSENTLIGSPIYQLKGIDPEGGKLRYSISGPVFTVDRDTGVVRLRQELDRETQDSIEVIISITDEGLLGTEPNTVSLRREIPIRDYNDNPPTFIGRPYSAKISESTSTGTVLDVRPPIIITDRDEGLNAEVKITCFKDTSSQIDACDTFEVQTDKISEGNFTAMIKLKKPLDFETRSSYLLTLMARDGATTNPLAAFATLTIDVIDVQDQPPIFLNAPYSATIEENTPENTSIFTISAVDGDAGNPRPLLLTLKNESLGCFSLQNLGNGKAVLTTTNIPLDREHPKILQNAGVYTFIVKATELIDNEIPGDFSISIVTIVVTDIDDHIPEFNELSYNISIPENLSEGMPLPGFSAFVIDRDIGKNSMYNLSLRNVFNAENVFKITPTEGKETTPVAIKVINSEKLDYDVEDRNLRVFVFEIIASVDYKEVSSAKVTVYLEDLNDNSPIFDQQSYRFTVKENEKPDVLIGNVTATDLDSGAFGDIMYILKGFGSENFFTHAKYGGLYTQKNLDYESQTSYSLTIMAIDGGNRESNANIFVDIMDLNDNYPSFESLEYTRTIREEATEFEPQFFVRAIDIDGPSQGGGKITYALESDNSISGNVFTVNDTTGEIRLRRKAKSMDTERGQYELIISAQDHGHPPLKNTTRALIRVGIPGNQRPIFKGQFRHIEQLPVLGPPTYRAYIPENATAGFNVTTVTASDPDGIDSLLRYKIVGANDNFVIDEKTGLIKVSSHAQLDRDKSPDSFEIVVNAVDAGFPIPETATTTVYVKILDVNNKPPKFDQPTYTAYVSEIATIGFEILKVSASDSDLNSKLEYEIIEPIRAKSKSGVNVSKTMFDARESFRIDNRTGQIFVNKSLNHDIAANVMLTVKVRDVNAEINVEKQFDIAEVNIIVQSFKTTNPVFKNRGWISSKSIINVKVKEEMPIGGVLFTLEAEDPIFGVPINYFDLIEPEKSGLFDLNERTGDILLKKRLDYESLQKNFFNFQVRANSVDGHRSTVAKVNITVENVNDNTPEFEKNEYNVKLIENKMHPEKIITVKAFDKDAILTDHDREIGFSTIIYSLQGENAFLFEINNITGEIIIAPNQIIDRELHPVIKLIVRADDSPYFPTESRQATVNLIIDVLDVNDNTPQFTQHNYTAVIPENVPPDTPILTVIALDPDDGPGGEVRYDFLNEGEINGLLKINAITGEIKTKTVLTGKGRSEPYDLVIRAQDNGGQVPKQESLYSDAFFTLYIGDVSANDGIPFFVLPKLGQVANISENATIGSPVFQVIASDPDNPRSPSGMLTYKIQEDILNAGAFRIDPETGLITTFASLDRETKDSYDIILEVSDNGQPPQSVTRILRIHVLDVDDHKPRFIRDIDTPPVEVLLVEEKPIGTVVINISAIDEDLDENGAIDYMFIDGNQEDLFTIKRTNDNKAIITTNKRIDREVAEFYMLTVKCFKYRSNPLTIPRGPYNKEDFSEIQILVKIQDIDDNLPEFEHRNPIIGIRINVPVETSIITVRAFDKDHDALPITYSIENITFVPQFYKRKKTSLTTPKSLFILNNRTGEIKTGGILYDYIDGYFLLRIKANNSHKAKRHIKTDLKIFVIRDKSLLRFVFTKPASEVQATISDFQKQIQKKLKPMDLELHIFDTQVLTKSDYNLDFSSTSSCFQMFKNGTALTLLEMQKLMDSDKLKEELFQIYVNFSVSRVESCSIRRKMVTASLMSSPGTWLVILSALIGLAAITATCTACYLAKKYKKHAKHILPSRIHSEPFSVPAPTYYSEPIYGPL